MRMLGRLAVAGASAIVLLQLVRPPIQSGPAVAEIQAPTQVRQILEKDCYSCHSNERRLTWFDEIVPPYWLVRHDIFSAREHLNFSTLGSKPAAAQKATLYEAVNMIQLGAMPLPQFTALHPDAKVTPEELTILKTYLAPWSSDGSTGPVASSLDTEAPLRANLAAVPAEFNGVAFQPAFEDWKPISFTDRGDNNTLRIILGNDIAVKAAQSGNISPWPDGTRFAKIAWQKLVGEDGLIHPGKFVQVEFMVKDSRLYKESEGWGWGRWRGTGLKPYGMDSRFVNECTVCHLPMRGDDFVYTLPITFAKMSRDEVLNNRAATLPQSLPYQPLGWNVITIYVDPRSHTMAALYGNDAAMHAARARSTSSAESAVARPGSVLALVTWGQREDPHWFGGRIPDTPKSVEFVQADAAGNFTGYRRYDGPELSEDRSPAEVAEKQTRFISNLAPVWLP
jgi:heme-binding protein/cytochrome P460